MNENNKNKEYLHSDELEFEEMFNNSTFNNDENAQDYVKRWFSEKVDIFVEEISN